MKTHRQGKPQQTPAPEATNWEAREWEARLQLDRERAADCRLQQGRIERDFATLVKIITTLAAAGIAGTSASLAAGTSNRALAAAALALLGLSLACIVVELIVAMRQAEEYAARLAHDETGDPGGPRWSNLIDLLIYGAALCFFAGLASLCCSWFFA